MPEPDKAAPAAPEAVPVLKPDLAQAALVFLGRATISFGEAEAAMRVRAALEAIAASRE